MRPTSLAVLALALGALVAPPRAAAQRAPAFELYDQYDAPFALNEQRGRLVLLLYADSKGSDYIDRFSAAAREWRAARGDTGEVRIIEAANLGGTARAPSVAARGRFAGPRCGGWRKSSVLLDWDGVIAKLYHARSDVTSAWLVDADGRVIWKGGGTGATAEIAAMRAALDAAATRLTLIVGDADTRS